MDRIIAVTNYPSVVWYSQDGRAFRSAAGFLGPLPKSSLAGPVDPRGWERYALRDLLYDAVASRQRQVKRGIAHFSAADAADRIHMAEAAAAWTARHKWAQARDFHDLWVKHLRAIEPSTTNR